jgi:hypothetical protein
MRDVQSLRNWVDGNRCMARDETSYLSDEKDLFSLSPTLDSAATRFEDWIEDRVAQFFCHSKLVSETIVTIIRHIATFTNTLIGYS